MEHDMFEQDKGTKDHVLAKLENWGMCNHTTLSDFKLVMPQKERLYIPQMPSNVIQNSSQIQFMYELFRLYKQSAKCQTLAKTPLGH